MICSKTTPQALKILRLGSSLVPKQRIRFYAASNVPFSAKISALIAKTSPEQIYTYQVPRLVKFGSWTLSGVFLIYGLSFADWSVSSSFELYQEESSQPVEAWWKHPRLLLAARTVGSVLLSTIPLTLAAFALYVPSRIITGVSYVPHGACELTRRALLSGKPISRITEIGHIVRNQKTKVFTGVGPQGTEDRSSFAFLLTDSRRPVWDRYYIVNRSGNLWAQDGRIFDALFGGDSIKSLERANVSTKAPLESKSVAPNASSIRGMITLEQTRSKLSDHAIRAKDIVMKSK